MGSPPYDFRSDGNVYKGRRLEGPKPKGGSLSYLGFQTRFPSKQINLCILHYLPVGWEFRLVEVRNEFLHSF